MSLNSSSAKYSHWLLRAVHGRIISYTCKVNGQSTNVERFEVILVGMNPEEYVRGLCGFDVKCIERASRAASKFTDNTVWILTKPALITDKAHWNGAPNKNIVLLDFPSEFKPVAASAVEAKIPCYHVSPPGRLREVLTITHDDDMFVDLTLFIVKVEPVRIVQVRGSATKARNITTRDDTAEAYMTAWGSATDSFDGLEGSACLILGITRGNIMSGNRISVRDSSFIHLAPKSPRMLELEGCRIGVNLRSVPSMETARQCAVELVGCAFVEMWDAETDDHWQTYQLQGVFINPLSDQMVTREDGKLFLAASLHDLTGSTKGKLTETSLLQLYDENTPDAVLLRMASGALEVAAGLWNVRGVRRKLGFVITEVWVCPLTQTPSTAGRKMVEMLAPGGIL